MNTKLYEYFAKSTVNPKKSLPLVHTLDWRDFVDIMNGSNILKAPKCDVFDPEHLVYLFYGRPCYKMHMGMGATSNTAMDTVCILFEPESLPAPKRIYPFDSGAFHESFYKDYTHPKDKKEQFEVKPELQSAKKIIGQCFGTNLNYYKEIFKKDLNPSPLELDAKTYIQLASSKAQSQFDSRKSAIEFQIEGDLDLTTTNVLAVIANEDVFDEPAVSTYIEDTLDAKKIGYFSPHSNPENEALVVMNKAKDFYETLGLFS